MAHSLQPLAGYKEAGLPPNDKILAGQLREATTRNVQMLSDRSGVGRGFGRAIADSPHRAAEIETAIVKCAAAMAVSTEVGKAVGRLEQANPAALADPEVQAVVRSTEAMERHRALEALEAASLTPSDLASAVRGLHPSGVLADSIVAGLAERAERAADARGLAPDARMAMATSKNSDHLMSLLEKAGASAAEPERFVAYKGAIDRIKAEAPGIEAPDYGLHSVPGEYGTDPIDVVESAAPAVDVQGVEEEPEVATWKREHAREHEGFEMDI
jgi:hypothetical protein